MKKNEAASFAQARRGLRSPDADGRERRAFSASLGLFFGVSAFSNFRMKLMRNDRVI